MSFRRTSSPQGAKLVVVGRGSAEQVPAATKKANADKFETMVPGFGDPTSGVRPLWRVAILETIRPSGQWSEIMKAPSFFGWYEILRTRHRWNVLQSIRYALWLARSSENHQARREARTIESNTESRGSRRQRPCSDSFRFAWSTGENAPRTEAKLHHGAR